jgi:hypothetical protein
MCKRPEEIREGTDVDCVDSKLASSEDGELFGRKFGRVLKR